LTLKDEGLLDSLTFEDEGIFFFGKARDHVSKDTVSYRYRKKLDSFISLSSILNFETHDSDFRNLVPTVRHSGFRRGITKSSLFRDVTPY
jgi:hypothetical protein